MRSAELPYVSVAGARAESGVHCSVQTESENLYPHHTINVQIFYFYYVKKRYEMDQYPPSPADQH